MSYCNLEAGTYTVQQSSTTSNLPKAGDTYALSLAGAESDPRFRISGPDMTVEGKVVNVFESCPGQVLYGVAKVDGHAHFVILIGSGPDWKDLYMEFVNLDVSHDHEHKNLVGIMNHNGQVHLTK